MAMKHVLTTGFPVFGDGMKFQLTLGFGDLGGAPPANESDGKSNRHRKVLGFRGGKR